MTFVPPHFPYAVSPEQRGARRRHQVAIVGGGPVGVTAAIDLALHGVQVVLLDDDDTVSTGSRAICWAKRTLEIFDRLGCAAPLLEHGITWSKGKVFLGDRLVYEFDLLPEGHHEFPAFINLQQYYTELFLVERARRLELADLRWRHRVVGIAPLDDYVALTVVTPDGPYTLEADWVIAADGARSAVRKLMGVEFRGKIFEDRFLIADVRMSADFPAERRFWFDPPFHRGRSALLHKQADSVWRIDLQLGPDANADEERKPERVIPRLQAMLGPERSFELEWVSVYTFQCRRLDRFRHGRVLFAGDAAHQVSPFGARGGNSGIQDVDNLCWKLALVVKGKAPAALLDTYDEERIPATDENLGHSTRATDFISPKGGMARALRNAVLELAEGHDFARAFVNSGRLSRPAVLAGSRLNTPDEDQFAATLVPGSPCPDAPVDGGWLLKQLQSGEFTGLCFGAVPADAPVRCVAPADPKGVFASRYDARPGTFYLIRPDQHVAARWRCYEPRKVAGALDRAMGVQ